MANEQADADFGIKYSDFKYSEIMFSYGKFENGWITFKRSQYQALVDRTTNCDNCEVDYLVSSEPGITPRQKLKYHNPSYGQTNLQINIISPTEKMVYRDGGHVMPNSRSKILYTDHKGSNVWVNCVEDSEEKCWQIGDTCGPGCTKCSKPTGKTTTICEVCDDAKHWELNSKDNTCQCKTGWELNARTQTCDCESGKFLGQSDADKTAGKTPTLADCKACAGDCKTCTGDAYVCSSCKDKFYLKADQTCAECVAPNVMTDGNCITTMKFKGQTWYLVRRVYSTKRWHRATDDGLGTQSYGNYVPSFDDTSKT